MKRIALILLALTSAVFAASDELEKKFTAPPPEARPWVYWFVLSGNMTKESITADLESMARVGIGGVLRFEVGQKGTPVGPVAYNGKEWHELFQHACKEAARLGLQINMANSPSWAGSGGLWITPEFSMQNVVWTETVADGGKDGKKVELTLDQPEAVMDYYRDVAVMAMPAPEGEGMRLAAYGAKVTSSGTEVKPGTFKLGKPEGNQNPFIQIEFPQPFTACWIKAKPNIRYIGGALQASNDGKTFRPVRNCFFEKSTGEIPCTPVTARFFRFEVSKLSDPVDESLELSDFNLGSSYRMEFFYGWRKGQTLPATFASIPASQTIPHDRIQDISSRMQADGKLTWEVPPGRWLILRFGCTTTGRMNFPAPEGGRGLECDKFSAEAAKVAFDGLMGKLIAQNKDLTGPDKTLVSTHIDSWECNSHSWTPKLREEFKKRRGYDLWSYLPVYTSRVVDNLEVSQRLRWDLRQTFAEMVAENYAGTFRRLANENGLRLSIEAYGDGCPANDLTYGAQADEPMAEGFSWNVLPPMQMSCGEMSSVAHVYGKKIVGAEAFTSHRDERWQAHPAILKNTGDWAFCEGINRFCFHRFASQRFENAVPGLGLGFWGAHYERTQTWWEQSKAWHEYVARCQQLLRQGLFVADVLYLQPEGVPRRFLPPDDAFIAPYIRSGYNFDGCSLDALINRVSVKDGKLVLPDGMSYRVLVVPPTQTMTLRQLLRIKELADQGATIIADPKPPEKSPTLADLGKGDEQVKKLAAELWPKLVTGKTAAQLLGERGIKPDFSAKPLLRYIHRATADTDFYFVANPEPKEVDAVAEFRITAKQPELWWPDTGRTELANDFEIKDGVTRVPLRLDPSGSVFVVFRQPAQTSKGMGKNWVETTPVQDITGPWEVRFDPKWGGPEKPVQFNKLQDWSQHPDTGIKYYSGHATYKTTFQAKKSGQCLLDLGKVAVMAEVTLNEKPLGILWKPPFKVDVSDALKDGENTLEVKVVNLWVNRMIGDEQLPEDSARHTTGGTLIAWPQWLLDGKSSPTGRFTLSTTRLWEKNDPLVESGLLGPVKLEAVENQK